MVDRQIIDEWLAKAEDDFRFAEMVLLEEKEYYNQICFHFQQRAEKYASPRSCPKRLNGYNERGGN